MSPVAERSGKTAWVHWRWQCPTFAHQTFVEWSALSIHYSFWRRGRTTSSNATRASHIPSRRERLRLNGYESSFVAGKHEHPTMNRFISMCWPVEVHPLSTISPSSVNEIEKTLDSPAQGMW